MVNPNSLQAELSILDEAQLKQVLSRIMLDISPGTTPLLDQGEVERHSEVQREIVQRAAQELNLENPEEVTEVTASAQRFVMAIAEMSPNYAVFVQEAVAEVKNRGTKLDFGLSLFVLNALVLAIAGAILRPAIDYSSETTKRGTAKHKFSFKFQGVPNIGNVIRAALPFTRFGKPDVQ